MGVEWSVPLWQPVRLSELMPAVERVAGEALGQGVRLEFLAGRNWALPAPDTVISATESLYFVVRCAGTEHAVAASVLPLDQAALAAAGLDDDDIDAVTWLTFLAYHTNPSRILALSAAIAAAELIEGDLVDEGQYLGRRVISPAQAVSRLRAVRVDQVDSLDVRAERLMADLNQTACSLRRR
jgi:hypothetical protein